ncbi:type IV toxin-antitoxin system AbiEi family antitoxin domain-containing protein [Marinivivus vitaminiproducens]|uniref:type IV toxin-antitoxin system AbiEi family antitoxin domain-containing protein n=1 Tax=Marinivivus vitaminiproducens TaxID=3035935 RepID=UPI003F9EC1DC
MGEQNDRKLNLLEKELPEGLLVDAAWLERRGYYGSLRKKYVDLDWLEQPAHRVYRRPRGALRWEQVVISLQTLLEYPIIAGGRTALELQGFSHYLTREQTEVHLYGRKAPPSWIRNLPLFVRFIFHKSDRLFRNEPVTRGLTSLRWNLGTGTSTSADPLQSGITFQTWGQWDWPLTLSTPERAILELLDELPARESFHQADRLMEGLSSLSPRRLQHLLEDCKSVKVKRLFFIFAERHSHAWFRRLDRDRIDLGKGKRMLVRGGKFDSRYGITLPDDLDAFQ